MLGNFTFHNPTKLYFGENSLENLSKELDKYGEKVMLVYGGGSIRKNGIYDAVLAELRKAGMMMFPIFTVYVTSLVERRNKEKQDYYKKIEQEPAKSAP